MSECRALTNVIGNYVATVVVANWKKQLMRNTVLPLPNLKTVKEIELHFTKP